ncbi:class I adenylate-forming enzyme family protein [Planktotalea sp.]|uniref:class I adenylate-forming enzyme family protein n=1 Tax=Planktotalea sp. TaxID=2029877 RepID=UPI0025FBFB57|nr:class I adenylate-forming enzyme family protein [Planktotalea sp.]
MQIHEFLCNQFEKCPDAIAIQDWDATPWSYHKEWSAAKAGADLLALAGVQRGDRVLMVTENCATLCAFIYACSLIGAWAVPVNARQTEAELNRIIDHATPNVALFFSSVSPDAKTHGTRMNARDVNGAWGTVMMAELGASDPASDPDVAVMLYTTGTTGTPKGVMLTHSNLVYAGQTSADTRGMTPSDTVYGALPMTHVFGLASMLMAATFAGATIRLEARFAAVKLYEALTSGVTILPAVPQMHALLMQYTSEQGIDSIVGGPLRYVSSGAAPLDPVWKRKAEAFYGIALQNGYGMTETSAGVCTTKSLIGDPDISVGPPLKGVEIRIDEGAEGGGNGIGEVLTRGPHIMLGYFRNDDATDKALDKDGWMHTGDLGKIDDHGLLHILGRSKELIIRGGFNIYPPEVEAAINDHQAVIQSAVIGRRTATGDEEVLAFVQVPTLDAVTTEDLHTFSAARLSGYKRPSQIILTLTLPAAPTGKLLKHKLLDTFADQLA